MKIGIDARLLSRPLTGIGRYTMEMCRALSQIPSVSLYLYSPSSIPCSVTSNFTGAVIRTGSWNNGALRQIWSETYLPMWAKKDDVDVFWGPAHRLPRCLPQNMVRVVTIHDLVWKYAGDTMRPFSRLLERYQMPRAVEASNNVVADSHATANALKKEFGINSEKLTVIPLAANSGVQLAPFSSLEKIGVNRNFFLFVGTLEPRKNLSGLLTAYSQVEGSLKKKAMLVIAGGKGWGGVDINQMVTNLGLENDVCVLGYVEEETLATLYANALFLAMPSLYEGFGLPLVEAMAYGTPVLTSNNSSMPEVAGDAGLLVDPLTTNSIKKGLQELISNHDLRDKLANKAQKNAIRFNWDTSAYQLIGVFERAIANRNNH